MERAGKILLPDPVIHQKTIRREHGQRTAGGESRDGVKALGQLNGQAGGCALPGLAFSHGHNHQQIAFGKKFRRLGPDLAGAYLAAHQGVQIVRHGLGSLSHPLLVVRDQSLQPAHHGVEGMDHGPNLVLPGRRQMDVQHALLHLAQSTAHLLYRLNDSFEKIPGEHGEQREHHRCGQQQKPGHAPVVGGEVRGAHIALHIPVVPVDRQGRKHPGVALLHHGSVRNPLRLVDHISRPVHDSGVADLIFLLAIARIVGLDLVGGPGGLEEGHGLDFLGAVQAHVRAQGRHQHKGVPRAAGVEPGIVGIVAADHHPVRPLHRGPIPFFPANLLQRQQDFIFEKDLAVVLHIKCHGHDVLHRLRGVAGRLVQTLLVFIAAVRVLCVHRRGDGKQLVVVGVDHVGQAHGNLLDVGFQLRGHGLLGPVDILHSLGAEHLV